MKSLVCLVLALVLGACTSTVVRGPYSYTEEHRYPGVRQLFVDSNGAYSRRLAECLALRIEQNRRQGNNPLADDVASCTQNANGGPPLHSTIPDDLRTAGYGGYGLGIGGFGYGVGGYAGVQGAYVPVNGAPVVAPTPVVAPAPVPAPVVTPAPNGGYVTQSQYANDQRVLIRRIEGHR